MQSKETSSLASYEHPATNPDPYHATREERRDATAVPQEMTRRFSKRMKIAVLRSALPLQKPAACVKSFMEHVHATTPFRFRIEGREALDDADIILANHQGPRIDRVHGCVNQEANGVGGTECLFAHALIPPQTRFVLKKFLVDLHAPFEKLAATFLHGQWRESTEAASEIIKALAFRKANPITVDRTLEKPPRYEVSPDASSAERAAARTPWESYVATMREERARVAAEICRSAHDDETPVIVYPEGTRSPDGKLLGFVSEFFESIITAYILPRMKTAMPIRLSLLVADTLRTFPNGIGSTVIAYDAPITLQGLRYDPTKIVQSLRARLSSKTTALDAMEIKHFGRQLLIDIHKAMSHALEEMLASPAIS